MNKSLRALVAGLAVAALALIPASASTAATDDPIAEFFTTYGVSTETQAALAAKYERLGYVDSMTRAVPVSSQTRLVNGSQATIDTFADGSIRVTSMEKAVPAAPSSGTGVSAYAGSTSLSGCTVTTGSGWAQFSNCLVQSAWGYTSMKFKVSYLRTVSTSAKITSYGSPGVYTPEGTMSTPWLALKRLQSTTVQDAVVKYGSVYTAPLNTYQETYYTAFWLKSDGSWQIRNS